MRQLDYKTNILNLSSTHFMSNIREIKKANLKRIMEEERVSPADLARAHGTTPQNINSFLTKGFKDEVVESLAQALHRNWWEFYSTEDAIDSAGIPSHIVQAMNDVKEILTLARKTGDDWYERTVLGALSNYREGVKRNVERRELIERLRRIESRLGISPEEGTGPAPTIPQGKQKKAV